MVREIGRKIARWWNINFEEVSYEEWKMWIVSCRMDTKLKHMFEGIWYSLWWYVWNYRNKLLFDDKIPMKAVIFDNVISSSFYWTAVNTISQEYLLEFTSEYGISKALHPELLGPEDRIVDFPEGKVGVYTKFFEFANFRLPLSQFLFDILGYYQIHLSQLSVIGAAKVSHFEINCRVLNIIPTLSLFRVFYTPSFNSGWMSFSKRPGKNTPQSYTKPLDSLKNWNNNFLWVDERVFPTIVDWRTSAPKDGMPAENTYSSEAVRILDTHHTHIQKQPEALLCIVGLSRRYYLGMKYMDMFSLIRAPDPTEVKTKSRPRAAHEVPLLTMTATRVIEMEDPDAATDSSGVRSTIERSPLDFAGEAGPEDQGTMTPEVPLPEDVPTTRGALEASQMKSVAATAPPVITESRKRSSDGVNANAPPKVLRRDHADPCQTGSNHGGKSLVAIELGLGSTRPTPVPPSGPADASDPDPLYFANPESHPPVDVSQSSQGTAASGDPESENTSYASMVGSPESIYRPEWGIVNGNMLDTPEAFQDLVDHVAPPGGDGVTAATEVRTGSETAEEISLLEADADMKKAAEDKSARLSQELEDMRALFSDLQVSNDRLSQQVATLQEQVSGEEKMKAAFKEFKLYEDSRVEQRYAKMDARLDALSIDFDEELYPHMLIAIACRRWMIGHGLRLAVMKCGESLKLRQAFAAVVSAGIAKGMSEGLRHEVEHGQAHLTLESIEAYDPKAETKYIAALQALKDLKYPLVDQLEGLKDAPMDVIMAALHLESDTGDDSPQWVRDLRPNSSQLTIPVYPEERDPMNPWACTEEMLLADVIAANVSRAEKKKKYRIVCRTHGVGSAHHARSDGVPVSVPTVVPQGLAILLADAATQTDTNEATLDNL
uniref:Transposase (Putative), gypsy type n=1 Tax=Tanacetum cinerariifolium TaxID=118510 RepID=A0A699HRP2_TANCI|nr:transposase (putative), gypsy type [Tanacetum cinerariifolium]